MTKRITRKDKEAENRLIEKAAEKVMEKILPVLEQTFNEQNHYFVQVLNKTITDGYKMVLEHSIDERKEALADLEDDGEAGYESESDKAFNDEHEKKTKENDDG